MPEVRGEKEGCQTAKYPAENDSKHAVAEEGEQKTKPATEGCVQCVLIEAAGVRAYPDKICSEQKNEVCQ